MAADHPNEYTPVPFPEGLPEIKLQQISLAKLLSDDAEEANRVFDICTKEGFFYLDLQDHPKGLRFLNGAHLVHDIGKNVFNNVSMEEKYKFEPRASYETGLLDTG